MPIVFLFKANPGLLLVLLLQECNAFFVMTYLKSPLDNSLKFKDVKILRLYFNFLKKCVNYVASYSKIVSICFCVAAIS